MAKYHNIIIRKDEEHEYKITVMPGNHGWWMFVALNGQTIFENPGYKYLNKAKSDGRAYVEYDYKENDTLKYIGKK